MSGLQARLASHLGSRDVAHVLYGATVGLAVVVAIQHHPPTAGVAAATLAGTALAIGLAELYAEAVSAEARTRRPVGWAHLRKMARDACAVTFGAGFPAVFFLLAALGVMTAHTALVLSKWSGLGLICGYGYLAARLAGFNVRRSLLRAAVVGFIGIGLIALKALVH
jgi:hypothetical protein